MPSIFNGQLIDDYYKPFWEEIKSSIMKISDAELIQLDATRVGTEIAIRYLPECPRLGSGISVAEPPFTPDQQDFYLSAFVPFVGDAKLFRYQGRVRPMIFENITIGDSELTISLRTNRHQLLQFHESIRAIVGRIEEGLHPIRESIPALNRELAQQATSLISKRQADLASHTALQAEMQFIGFPIRKREDTNPSAFVPVKPTRIEFQPQPGVAKHVPTPDHELALGDYDEILRVIQNMVTVFERSPSVFAKMEEEHLRTILLVGLNGLFEGKATGETFNGEGKTDILIRVNNNNIFIAECLIWAGPEHFKAKLLNQLFRYSTWRDSKLAAIVFNRRKNFTDVVQKMRDVVSSLDNKVSEMTYTCPTACRHRFRRADDIQKEFVLTCLAFDVPVGSGTPS